VRHNFKPLLGRAGLPDIRFHDLRHTCATLLFSRNVHPKIVQELLGRSSITLILDTYSHYVPSLAEAIGTLVMEEMVTVGETYNDLHNSPGHPSSKGPDPVVVVEDSNSGKTPDVLVNLRRSRASSSVVEQGTFNPRVEGSIPSWLTGPHRLEAQDTALSRRRHGFESRWGHCVGRTAGGGD
jgi:hypothetical protein